MGVYSGSAHLLWAGKDLGACGGIHITVYHTNAPHYNTNCATSYDYLFESMAWRVEQLSHFHLNSIQLKMALRVATGSHYNSHTEPLLAQIKSLKFHFLYSSNLVKIGNALVNGNGVGKVFTVLEPDKRLRNS
jgi:hypothetical protein